jgi:hypothetical protein
MVRFRTAQGPLEDRSSYTENLNFRFKKVAGSAEELRAAYMRPYCRRAVIGIIPNRKENLLENQTSTKEYL